jgi:hypothetical protein
VGLAVQALDGGVLLSSDILHQNKDLIR